MNRNRTSGYAAMALAAAAAAVTVAGCGGSGAAAPVVPSLSQSAHGAAAHGGGSARASALHAAAVQQACGHLLTAADLNPGAEPPAPVQLVQAGVASAECMRAHGMPHVQDPSSRSPYTPGHGFGLTASEGPPGG